MSQEESFVFIPLEPMRIDPPLLCSWAPSRISLSEMIPSTGICPEAEVEGVTHAALTFLPYSGPFTVCSPVPSHPPYL